MSTTYWFEYGQGDCSVTSCEKIPASGIVIGGGHKVIPVAQGIAGLQPRTTYFYRVIAENAEDVTKGPVKTFTTQGLGLGFALSDSRIWELVSPTLKYGGTVITSDLTAIQAATSGGRLAYASLAPIVGDTAGSRSPAPATVLAERGEDGRWSSRDLTPPHSDASALRPETEYKVFTPDLAQAVMEPTDDMPLSAESSEQTPYLWADGNPQLFTPLLRPGNVPPETKFGPGTGPADAANPVRVEGASADLGHLIIRSDEVALAEGAIPKAIYMWADGQAAGQQAA